MSGLIGLLITVLAVCLVCAVLIYCARILLSGQILNIVTVIIILIGLLAVVERSWPLLGAR